MLSQQITLLGCVMRNLVIGGLISLGLVACDAPSTPASPENTAAVATETVVEQTESQRLNEWFEAQYEQELMFSPITLTMQGRKDRYAEIDDFTEAYHAG